MNVSRSFTIEMKKKGKMLLKFRSFTNKTNLLRCSSSITETSMSWRITSFSCKTMKTSFYCWFLSITFQIKSWEEYLSLSSMRLFQGTSFMTAPIHKKTTSNPSLFQEDLTSSCPLQTLILTYFSLKKRNFRFSWQKENE